MKGNGSVKIIVDAMGADNSPSAQVMGCVEALEKTDADIVLVGDENEINKILSGLTYDKERLIVRHASDVITNDDDPALSVRRKKDASVTVAAAMIKNGEGDAFVSFGSTGAVLSAALLIIGRIKGVLRPAMAPVFPTANGPCVLVDCGANADCRPEMLSQFALMGSIYSKNILGKENPSVGLVNIGSEAHKGNKLAKETYPLLSDLPINFKGNCEARDIMSGEFDVVVTDGFTGNVILKLIEGLTKELFGKIKGALMTNIKTKIGALLIKKSLYDMKKQLDYSEYGAALFLGVKKPVLKGHGSSDKKAVTAAVIQAYNCVKAGIIEKTEGDISALSEDNEE